MKVGIYGGSFNPPHLGHEQVAKFVIDELKLDELVIVPVGTPSHRENNLASCDDRLAMCKLAFEKISKVAVSDIEIRDEKVSYTYDTLMNIKKLYSEQTEFYEIIGEDSACYFDKWKEYRKIFDEAHVVVLKRKGCNIDDINRELKDKFIYLDSPYFNFSSTEIRERVKNNFSNLDEYVSEDVSEYIREKKLYKY